MRTLAPLIAGLERFMDKQTIVEEKQKAVDEATLRYFHAQQKLLGFLIDWAEDLERRTRALEEAQRVRERLH